MLREAAEMDCCADCVACWMASEALREKEEDAEAHESGEF